MKTLIREALKIRLQVGSMLTAAALVAFAAATAALMSLFTAMALALAPGRRWHDALYDAAGSLCLLRALVRGLHIEEATLGGLSFALQEQAG